MKRVILFLVLAAFAMPAAAWAGDNVGFREIGLPRTPADWSLDVAVWYPAREGGTIGTIGENPVFYGLRVAVNAPAESGRHPLVVLSHGYSGNWSNQAWLADSLVRHGYIVAATNHPGTTTRDVRPVGTAELLERPRDISRVIDALTSDPLWAALLDPERIAAIGHSLGGWTVMELAGAQFDAVRFNDDCRRHPALAACKIAFENGWSRNPDETSSRQSRRDARIKAVVSLDVGMARGFAPSSVRAINLPVLIVAGGHSGSDGIPAELESDALTALLPASKVQRLKIDDAAHFSFLLTCKPGAVAILEADHPGDKVVCEDGGGRDRAALHEQMTGEIIRFLADALKPR